MNADELIEAIRVAAKKCDGVHSCWHSATLNQAADLIESQATEIQRLTASLNDYKAPGLTPHEITVLAQRRHDCKITCLLDRYEELLAKNGCLQAKLTKSQAREQAAIADLKHTDNCDICKHNVDMPGCECECSVCELSCMCKECRNESNFEWRGQQEDGKETIQMTKQQALNSLEVIDFSVCGDEVEYVLAEATDDNVQTLLDEGFTAEQLDDAKCDDGTHLDLALLAFHLADADWWDNEDGFTQEWWKNGEP